MSTLEMVAGSPRKPDCGCGCGGCGGGGRGGGERETAGGRWVRRGNRVVLLLGSGGSSQAGELAVGIGINRKSPAYIRWVQQALNKILGLQLRQHGVMDAPTRTAIRSFQQRNGLKADGIVGPTTEAALLKRGAQPVELTPRTSAPAPSRRVDCTRVKADCFFMTPEEERRVKRSKNREGDLIDRTQGERQSNLALQLADYDVNDWRLQKPKHSEGLGRLHEFIIRGVREGQTVEVTVTGSASRTGSKQYNDLLSCKRARCVADAIRAGILARDPALLRRVRINPSGEGFTRATCKGKECELPEFRSVLVQVHAPGKKPPPIPIVPPRGADKYAIRCCSFRTETLFEGMIGDLLDKSLEKLPAGARRVLERHPALKKILNVMMRKAVEQLKKLIQKKLPRLNRLLSRVLAYMPVEIVRDRAVFQIVERGRTSGKTIDLCYTGYGVRVPVPRPDLLNLIPEHLRGIVEEFLNKLIPPEKRTVPPIETACARPTFKDFDLNRPATLRAFVGSAAVGRGTLKLGAVALTFKSPPFTARPDRRLRLRCNGCLSNTIEVRVGDGAGFEIAAGTEGSLHTGACKCVECADVIGRRGVRPAAAGLAGGGGGAGRVPLRTHKVTGISGQAR